jgi:hypothetical protein
MAYLTSKARRFVDLAMQMPENARYAAAWAAWQEHNPITAHPTELAPEAARMFAVALQELEKSLLRRIEEAGEDEDAAADYENDLSSVEAVQRGITESRVAL